MNQTPIADLLPIIKKDNYWWWHNIVTEKPLVKNRGELILLGISEIIEAQSGIRKNLMDDHLPHRTMEEVEMADTKIRCIDYLAGFGHNYIPVANRQSKYVTDLLLYENKSEQMLQIVKIFCDAHTVLGSRLEIEFISEVIDLVELYCNINGLDLESAMLEKLEYNRNRKDHTREARLAADGKKF